jgi:hypothetical protein
MVFPYRERGQNKKCVKIVVLWNRVLEDRYARKDLLIEKIILLRLKYAEKVFWGFYIMSDFLL